MTRCWDSGSLLGQATQVTDGARVADGRFAQRHVGPIFERHHQLDAIERREAELVQRHLRLHDTAGHVLRQQPLHVIS
jgi:hypothetical protein